MSRGTISVALLVAAASGAFAQSVTITTPTTLPTGYVGVSYLLTPPFAATTNPPNQTLTWSLAPSNVSNPPPGITLAANGNFFGTPTTAGTYSFIVAAQFGGASGPPIVGTQTILDNIVQPQITITAPRRHCPVAWWLRITPPRLQPATTLRSPFPGRPRASRRA